MTDDLPFVHPAQDPDAAGTERARIQVLRTLKTRRRRRRALVAAPTLALLLVTAVALARWDPGAGNDRETVNAGQPGTSGTSGTSTAPAASEDDPPATSPEVDHLWTIYLEAERCLEADGFTLLGPVPISDGSGLQYVVRLPPGVSAVPSENGCEAPLNADAASFSRSASPEARTVLVDQFRATMACLGLEPPSSSPDPADGTLERDLDAEAQVMTRLMGSEADDAQCSGPQG
jgi:hypothetical protein